MAVSKIDLENTQLFSPAEKLSMLEADIAVPRQPLLRVTQGGGHGHALVA